MFKKFLLPIFTVALAACVMSVQLGQTFQLKYGASANVKDTPMKVTFQNVVDDRCVIGAGCADGGHATITLKVENGESIKIVPIELAGTGSATTKEKIDNFEFMIGNLRPLPVAGVSIQLKDYVLDLTIQKLANLADYYWKLDTFGFSGDEPASVMADTPYILSFEFGAKGRKACQKFIADYSVSDNAIRFNDIFSSLDVCTHQNQETLDNQTAFFDSALAGADNYSVGSDSLKIVSSDAKELNFKGIKKREDCGPKSSSTFPNDLNMCKLTCAASVPATMACLPAMIAEQCELFCSIK
ncbi:MAG TPA: META domain-containing protein [Cyclobacteriaceae bacterium]|nr:META domain-containing protein [Cyclobacteriaceae bacterium]